ncbi:MAG: hypothetical protein J5I90_15570 [Caldilineales bacterium]|nr:hypothetical protein [Caldilineales bacterium]
MLQEFFNSAFALRIGLFLGRIIPGWLGYTLADIVTWFVARGNTALVHTVHQNLRVVLSESADQQEIEVTARAVFRNAGRAYFDFYRGVAKGRDSVLGSVMFTDRATEYLSQLGTLGGSAVVVNGHMSNFDLAGLAFSAQGVPTQALTFRAPSSGYDLQNQIRESWGLEITPVSVVALRQAIRRLRGGGLVVTGADRPDPTGAGEPLIFFGHPAILPSGHIRLALQAGAPIAVAIVRNHTTRPHAYEVDVTPPFRLQMIGDRNETIRYYAQKILSILESAIREHPDQWLMFYPVWPGDENASAAADEAGLESPASEAEAVMEPVHA